MPEQGAGPLAGVRVVELATWVAAPACGMLLGDWGADVVKVEAPGGDVYRGMVRLGPEERNPAFELDNRGKRSITLDLETERGRALLDELLGGSDVLLSNFLPGRLDELGLAPEAMRRRFPRLVVATLTGFGEAGPDRDRPSYDMGGFWARSGMADMHTAIGEPPPTLRGAAGDHLSASALAAAICAALLERVGTGEGRHVTTSLLRNGLWALSQDANILLRSGVALPSGGRAVSRNPLYNCYLTRDGRWLWLLGLLPDRHWPALAVALGHPEWLDDERFASMAARAEHSPLLAELFDEAFARHDLEDWRGVLDGAGVWWEPVATMAEALDDPQADAAGVFVAVDHDGDAVRAIAGPVDFVGSAPSPGRAPEAGEHTEEVLLELGHTWDEIVELRDGGALG